MHRERGRRYALPVRRALVALVIAAAASPGCERTLPAYGSVSVVVDTDLAVPSQVARLRVDVFADDGTWLDTRDVALRDRSDWPASFTLFQTGDARARRAVVRVRAYPSTGLRDYRGERFVERPTGGRPTDRVPDAPPTDGPRLVVGGVDVTPSQEPDPILAIDRLARVSVATQGAERIFLRLRADCAGTMADLAGARTCVDTDGALVAIDDASPDDPITSSSIGQAAAPVPCTAPLRAAHSVDGVPLFDEETCVPGGMFVLGGDIQVGYGILDGHDTSPLPPRWTRIDPLRVDRYEVTVGRFRDALARGFAPFVWPAPNEGPLATSDKDPSERLCTWSDAPRPGAEAREDFALTCATWEMARAFCKFEGGDLPTEAEWEYVAAAAARPAKTAYPWGDDGPACDRVVFGRSMSATKDCIAAFPYGPRPVADGPGDETPAAPGTTSGVHGLAGGVFELTRDAFAPYSSVCWKGAPQREPWCDFRGATTRSVRGGAWDAGAVTLRSAGRLFFQQDVGIPDVGFRCVRKGTP